MLLSDTCIMEEIAQGRLFVDPFSSACVSPASLDLRLGSEFFVPSLAWRTIDVEKPGDVGAAFNRVDAGDCMTIHSGQMLLGVTVEEIGLPADITGILHGRSSLGRLGLAVHITAGLIDPGFRGRITLELVNHSPFDLRLKVGMRIAQLAFHRMERPASKLYNGKYQGAKTVQLSMVSKDFGDE